MSAVTAAVVIIVVVDNVVNDQTGPVAVPPALLAMTCQKYVVPADRFDGAYEDIVRPTATADGGLVVPRRIS